MKAYLIQKQNLRTGDKLTCHADATFLSTTDAFANWSTNNRLRLLLETKCLDQRFDTALSICFVHSADKELEAQIHHSK